MPRYYRRRRGRTVVTEPYSRQSISRLARQYRTAVVKKGENIKELARRLGTTEQDLIRQNKKLYSYKAGAVVKVKKSKATGSKWRKKVGGRGKVQAKEIPEAPIYTGPYAPGYQAPEEERITPLDMMRDIFVREKAKRPTTYDLGRTRITATGPTYIDPRLRGFQAPAQPAAPTGALRPDITGSIDEATYNRLYTISAKYTADAFRHALTLEDDLDRYNVMPNLLSARMARDLNLSAYEMDLMGYERIGNWWRKISLADLLNLEAISPTPEEMAGEGAGVGYGGYGGYAPRRGGGGGGGGGGGITSTQEGGVKQRFYPRGLYPNITLGHFMRNIAGRQYTPEFGGMIHWRL